MRKSLVLRGGSLMKKVRLAPSGTLVGMPVTSVPGLIDSATV